jgi:hypothetical protein
MKNFYTYIYVAILVVMGAGSSYAQDGQFFETLYDIPVMAGLEEIPEMALSFDKVGGRIAEAGAVMPDLSDREVISFYNISLEQMGWQRKQSSYDPYVFIRESEKLSIFIDKSKNLSVIRFLLQPIEAVNP